MSSTLFNERTPQISDPFARQSAKAMICGAKLLGNGTYLIAEGELDPGLDPNLRQIDVEVIGLDGGQGLVTTEVGDCALPPNGSSQQCRFSVPEGVEVSISAFPGAEELPPLSGFVGWAGACGGSALDCDITVTQGLHLGAIFRGPHTLKLDVIPPEGLELGRVLVSRPDDTESCKGNCEFDFPGGLTVNLVVEEDELIVFEDWSGACSGNGPVCRLTMNEDLEVTARFSDKEIPEDTVTLDLVVFGLHGANGRVQIGGAEDVCVLPEDGSSMHCRRTFLQGSSVFLWAFPSWGEPTEQTTFAGWSGPCEEEDPFCELTLNEDVQVAAHFQGPHSLKLELIPSPQSGLANVGIQAGEDILGCDDFTGPVCEFEFPAGTVLTLQGQEDIFGSWSGDCTGTDPSCAMVMMEDREVTAQFVDTH